MRNYFRAIIVIFFALCWTGVRHAVNEYWDIAFLSRLPNTAQKGLQNTMLRILREAVNLLLIGEKTLERPKVAAETIYAILWKLMHLERVIFGHPIMMCQSLDSASRVQTWSPKTKNFIKRRIAYARRWKVKIMLLYFVWIKPRFLSIVANRQY